MKRLVVVLDGPFDRLMLLAGPEERLDLPYTVRLSNGREHDVELIYSVDPRAPRVCTPMGRAAIFRFRGTREGWQTVNMIERRYESRGTRETE